MLSISHVHGKHSTWKEQGGDLLAGTTVTLAKSFFLDLRRVVWLHSHWDIPKQKKQKQKKQKTKVMAIAMQLRHRDR